MAYFDNAATTKMDPAVFEELKRLDSLLLGNASSTHTLGTQAAKVVERARFIIARSIGASPEEILFTSSGTESNNLALKGYCLANKDRGNHIIVSEIEHACVSGAVAWLGENGFTYSVVGVDREGYVRLDQLQSLITDKTILVSVMHANNEIGTVQNIDAIAEICDRADIAFHTDAVQSYLKIPINLKKTPIDLLTLSAHKVHGPKGVAALFIRKDTKVEPLMHGGGQEYGLRSGTLNTEGISGFAKAVEAFKLADVGQMHFLKSRLIQNFKSRLPFAELNGPETGGVCNIVNFSFAGFPSANLITELQRRGFYVSAGSACLSKKATGSFVIRALAKNENCIQSAIRISLSKFTTLDEIERLTETLEEICLNQKSPTYVASPAPSMLPAHS